MASDKDSKKSSTGWTVFLQCAALLYLFFELSFNARLLTAAGGISDPEKIHGLETAGRIIAGLGATLMAWRFMGFRGGAAAAIPLAVAAVIIIPAIYFGQKAIIDVALSTATKEEKRAAYIAAMARKNVADGVVAFSSLKEGGDPARDATFNATLGIFIMRDDAILKEIESKMDDIATRTVYKAAGGDDIWARYQSAHDKINQALKDYAGGSAQVAGYQSQAQAKAQEVWDRIQAQVNASWTSLDSKRQMLKGGKGMLVEYAQAKLRDVFKKIIACNATCINDVRKAYDVEMTAKFGGPIPLDWWCSGWNGKGVPPAYAPATQASCPGSDATVTQVINLMLERQFRKETEGMDPNISYSGFIASEPLQKKIKAELEKQHIDTAALVFPLEKSQFMSVMTGEVQRAASREFGVKVETALGMPLEPGLDPNTLLQRPDVRAAVAAKYGLDADVPLGLDRAAFEKQVLLPKLRGQADAIKAAIDAPDATAKHEDALRFLIIPPVALAFSLFFSILNAGSFLISFAGLAAPRLKPVLSLVFLLGVIGIPFLFASPGKDNPMYATSIVTLKETAPLMGLGVDWLNRVEPTVLPLAEGVRRNILFGITFGYGDKNET